MIDRSTFDAMCVHGEVWFRRNDQENWRLTGTITGGEWTDFTDMERRILARESDRLREPTVRDEQRAALFTSEPWESPEKPPVLDAPNPDLFNYGYDMNGILARERDGEDS